MRATRHSAQINLVMPLGTEGEGRRRRGVADALPNSEIRLDQIAAIRQIGKSHKEPPHRWPTFSANTADGSVLVPLWGQAAQPDFVKTTHNGICAVERDKKSDHARKSVKPGIKQFHWRAAGRPHVS
jgi:hypothetical protein